MADVLVIQNTRIEGSGSLGRLLEQDGFDVSTVYAKKEPVPTNPRSMLIVLGGPESANDGLPYLQDEQALIRSYVKGQRPVLGICLGSQLIARAFGARVHRGPKAEVGFYHDLLPDADSGLFAGFSSPFSAFHWHRDTFELPDGAARLASSAHYANQAFQIGSAVGVQFHLEVDLQMVNLWLDSTEERPESNGIDPQRIRREAVAGIAAVESNMQRFYRNFKSEFGL